MPNGELWQPSGDCGIAALSVDLLTVSEIDPPGEPNSAITKSEFGFRLYAASGMFSSSRPASVQLELLCRPIDAPQELKDLFFHTPLESTLEDRLCHAKSWLTECIRYHRLCRRKLSGQGTRDHRKQLPLPSRVIDVTGRDGPKLTVTSKRQTGTYCALSYCWNNQSNVPVVDLRKENLARFKEGLPMDEIPKTIQDAILVTRKLDIRYLWVSISLPGRGVRNQISLEQI
jgi:hypothetical protein